MKNSKVIHWSYKMLCDYYMVLGHKDKQVLNDIPFRVNKTIQEKCFDREKAKQNWSVLINLFAHSAQSTEDSEVNHYSFELKVLQTTVKFFAGEDLYKIISLFPVKT